MLKTIDQKEHQRTVKAAALVLRALQNPLRIKMISAIRLHNSITVTQLYKLMKLEQSVCSQQLAILREAGVAVAKRDGKLKFYSINDERVNYIINLCEQLNIFIK